MSNHSLSQAAIGHEEVILRRTAKGLGVSLAGLEGTLGGDAYRIIVRVVIPKKIAVDVWFSTTPSGATA